MKPGRELDALVVEKVMGVEKCAVHHSFFCCGRGRGNYSTDIAAAWEVVEKLAENHGQDDLISVTRMQSVGHPSWEVQIWLSGVREGDALVIEGDTAPHAICLAALRAKGVEL